MKLKGFPATENIFRVFHVVKIVVLILFLIYLFMCGVDLLTSSFKLIAGKNINGLTKAGTLNNPLIGLIVGVLVTIMVQSSSTSTAIIVSLVSSGVIRIEQAIPIVMGSNIGTSVTNTFVSFTQVQDREMFRKAFAGATVHDMFNWLCVFSLLSVEILTKSIPGSRGLLEFTTEMVVNATFTKTQDVHSDEPTGLKHLIAPLTSKIITLNKDIIACWAKNESTEVTTLIKRFCDPVTRRGIGDHTQCPAQNPKGIVPCCSLFSTAPLSDVEIGVILLISSLALLIICLIVLVKVLNSVLQGPVQEIVKKYINSDLPFAPSLTGYVALLIGAVLTVVMQSSSVFTSLLTPLIGMGVVSIERCYPLTLGANIGTTTTALLAAFTENSKASIQIALVHLFFNVIGIMIFYPIPFMRFPIPMCKFLGKITAKYRWFAVVYIVGLFILIPCFLLGLRAAGVEVFWTVLGLISLLGLIIIIINMLQKKNSDVLPPILQDWSFLPSYFTSLEPYDKVISSVFPCGNKQEETEPTSELTRVSSTRPLGPLNSFDSGIGAEKRRTENL